MINPPDVPGALHTNNLKSEIINKKKQFVFEVAQSDDYIYPNQEYQYQIFCKNNTTGSGNKRTIKDVHIQVINPSEIAINEDTYPTQGIEIGDLTSQQSELIYLKARCSTTGTFTVHFLCFGEHTGIFVQSLQITCDYNTHNGEAIHRLHVYNFQPYEDTYMLSSRDYSDTVTQLTKIQKLPYKAKEHPFGFETDVDESQSYINHNQILYGDIKVDDNQQLYGQRVDSDEHSYQYIERENFNHSATESYEGQSLIDLFNQINEKSRFLKATFLKSGNNEMETAFQPYYPNGFLYRFGILSSEIYHHIGVLPTFTYMNDLLFRWAPDNSLPKSLTPKITAMHWNEKKWAGHGWDVYKVYTDEYKNIIQGNIDYKPLMEFMHTFTDLRDAERFIELQTEHDKFEVHFTTVNNEVYQIPKYRYILKENFADSGVFFVNIPLDKIPSNFFILENTEIQNIVQRTKPLGMRPLIRYHKHISFNNNIDFDFITKIKTKNAFDIGEQHKFNYYIQSQKYRNIIEKVCHMDEGTEVEDEREVLKLIPSGMGYYNALSFNHPVNPTIYPPQPKIHKPIKSHVTMSSNGYYCNTDNELIYMSQLHDLLYQGNFEAISFFIKDLSLLKMDDSYVLQGPMIDKIDYQLWIDSLKQPTGAGASPNQHSCIWNVEPVGEYYFLSDATKRIDFMEINLTNPQFTAPNIETGIGMQDTTSKYHGISAEYNPNTESFNIKYATSLNDNFKVKKLVSSDMIGLAYKLIYTPSNTLVIFFIKQKDGNDDIVYNYFHHIIVPTLTNIFCFTRNERDITVLQRWSNIINYGKDTDAKVSFNTPQYEDIVIYDADKIIVENLNPWKNVSKIDRNEYSYASATNQTNEIKSVDDIQLHYENLNIPDDAIVKRIMVRATLETNTEKEIYYNYRVQDNFIMDSGNNNVIAYPDNIEGYKLENYNIDYYTQKYEGAQSNNATSDAEMYRQKIIENELFNETLDITVDDYLNDFDDYITIENPMWLEISDFDISDASFNDINNIAFTIEGYNEGKEVYLKAQLTQNNILATPSEIKIPCGYFKKTIRLSDNKQFNLSDVKLRFTFKELNSVMKIFNTYINIEFNNKQQQMIPFSEYHTYNIMGKKIIYMDILEDELPAYLFNNGLTVNLAFEDLYTNEYYRIYAVELDVLYQKQSIDFLINKNIYQYINTEDTLFVVSGNNQSDYMCGMFFDDLPSISQLESVSNTNNIGLELRDTVYQSFVAKDDNISSITLFPNGFIGNPDINLKIALYTNQGHTPHRLIKEIRVNGWSKTNTELYGKNDITYNFNVNNLNIGETYWIKISIDEIRENSYYLLKYIDTPVDNLKLLVKNNNDLINVFGALKFQLNRINLYNSFNNIPISQYKSVNPNIFISINKNDGFIEGLRVKKQIGVNNG